MPVLRGKSDGVRVVYGDYRRMGLSVWQAAYATAWWYSRGRRVYGGLR